MAYEQRDNTGSMWPNQRKETERHPDRTGSARIDGVDYWINGWIKTASDGRKWLSLSFRAKDPSAAHGSSGASRTAPQQEAASPNDEDVF